MSLIEEFDYLDAKSKLLETGDVPARWEHKLLSIQQN